MPNLTAIQKGRRAIANMLHMINKSSKCLENSTALSRLKGEIAFRHVSFSYPSEPKPVLNDLSFLVEPGNTIAFVGPSGSGKSTIVSLVQRFYDPTSGILTLPYFLMTNNMRQPQSDLHFYPYRIRCSKVG